MFVLYEQEVVVDRNTLVSILGPVGATKANLDIHGLVQRCLLLFMMEVLIRTHDCLAPPLNPEGVSECLRSQLEA